jgi:hypothetical protein
MMSEDDANGEPIGPPPPERRTKHARRRGEEGRPTGTAFNDAQSAAKAEVFLEMGKALYVVRRKRGREHLFSSDGRHVTTLQRTNAAHQQRLEKGDVRPVSDEEYKQFKRVIQ